MFSVFRGHFKCKGLLLYVSEEQASIVASGLVEMEYYNNIIIDIFATDQYIFWIYLNQTDIESLDVTQVF